MKKMTICLITLVIISSAHYVQAKTIEEYLTEAANYQEYNNIEQAIIIMEEAVKKYPENSDAYTQLGIYIGEKAQRMHDFSEIFQLTAKAFEMWYKAISLDPNNITARFYRGAWGVMIPKFAGQLETGINDLEFLVNIFEQSTDINTQVQLVSAYQHLAAGYQKQGELSKAKEIYEKAIKAAPKTEYATEAQGNLDKIVLFEKWQSERDKNKKPDSPMIIALKEQIEREPKNTTLLLHLGKAYVDAEKYEEAEKALKQAIDLDPSNVDAWKLLALVLEKISMEGYDLRISIDTDFRTNLAFEAMQVLDKVVALAPEDTGMRLHRGIAGVQMPFFVGKLEQAMDDLKMVLDSDVSDDMKSQTLYWLGYAHQKKAMSYWTEVVTEYSESEASQFVFDKLNPTVKRIDPSKYKKPIVIIDFVLGFCDELAPQTAVWVEDKDGNFIKTVYVSGFSGYAADKQINLPLWSKTSEFIDVDGVTGASIDLGHHIYVWNTKDIWNKKVKSGDYIIKVEVSYWPSMQYQRVEVPIKIGKKDQKIVIEQGNLIPYLEVKYIR